MTTDTIPLSLTPDQIYTCVDIANAERDFTEDGNSTLADILDAVTESLYTGKPITVSQTETVTVDDNVVWGWDFRTKLCHIT